MDCSFMANLVSAAAASCSLWTSPWVLAQTKADAVAGGISWDQYLALLIALAVLVLPFVVGNFLAKRLKMPNYGTRFGWILLAIAAAATVLTNRLPGLGVDLSGGTILVYEMDPGKRLQAGEGGGQNITSEDLVEPLTRRINPAGTQEIVIRPYGESQIEIIVPAVDQREVDRIKQLIEEAGILRFAIVANQADHQDIIDLAREQAESDKPLREIIGSTDGIEYGRWVQVGREANEIR